MNHYCLILYFSLISFIGLHTSAVEIPELWYGKSGEDLKRAVTTTSRPKTLIDKGSGIEGYWQIIKQTDSDPEGNRYLNRFSNTEMPFLSPSEVIPTNYYYATIVPTEWWSIRQLYADTIRYDLYNRVPATENINVLKGKLPPGIATTQIQQFALWHIGNGNLKGQEHTFWQPPKGYEGDVARIMFYMLTIYPDNIDCNTYELNGYCDEFNHQILTADAARLLLAWHNADPVDQTEMKRNDVFEQVQGNRNPFVDFPQLTDYIWGQHSDEPFAGGELPEDPELEAPLRGTYKLTDQRINLKSPIVPDDAQWEINGIGITDNYLVPADLGSGRHELRFISSTTSGKVIILIEP